MTAMKRALDLAIALVAFLILLPPMLAIAVAVRMTSRGSILYWSDRVGRRNRIFRMPKFRTMKAGTPALATHLMQNPDHYLTPIGSFLRRTSLDELPQLWSVIRGDMSLVGPRPALFNQDDLVALRTARGLDELVPGVTGWAQIMGRDSLPIPDKVALEFEYYSRRSLLFDLRIIAMTFVRVLKGEGVSH